ncbi:MAG: rRNA maturation RNase YbeY [Spirochaetales bacterium]|nr:rRNA maturation RNase YbeY [Spirochaetales bacterium]
MHQMNKDFRDIDDSTDILSFAAEDEEDGFSFISAGRRKRVLGDILICPQVLSRNAERFGVTENEELRRLLIHGVLHLSGENHSTNDPSEPMLVKQEKILSKIGQILL